MNPRYSGWIALGLAIAGTMPSGSVPAQTQQEWMLCQDLRSPDYPIQGCTAVIQAGRQILDRLAFAYNNRGVAYRLKAEYDKAIADFDEAIKLRPDYPNAFNNRGVAYRNKGDLDHAMADYDQSITLKPDYLAAYYNRGLVLQEKGAYDKAIADFTTVLRANPNDRRGEALLKKGDAKAGNADMAEARAIRPDIAEAVARSER